MFSTQGDVSFRVPPPTFINGEGPNPVVMEVREGICMALLPCAVVCSAVLCCSAEHHAVVYTVVLHCGMRFFVLQCRPVLP